MLQIEVECQSDALRLVREVICKKCAHRGGAYVKSEQWWEGVFKLQWYSRCLTVTLTSYM